MSDLRALIIGIIGGIISVYATQGINRYLAGRTVRGRRRQLKQLTQEFQLLEKLGLTDRSLLLFAFRMLFPMLAFAAVGIAGSVAFSLLAGPPYNPTAVILLMVCAIIFLVAVRASNVFQKLEDPEPTLVKLRQKIQELEAQELEATGERSPKG